jgi:hypothetical protein
LLPLIVSYFTRDWHYPQHAARLAGECEALGLEAHIEERESRGGYTQNCCIKPEFIRECLQTAGRPVLWVDVDASILRKPDFFLGADGWDFQARKMASRRRRTWHVGTLWFNPTPATLDFVDEWVARTGDMTDESALDQTWKARDWGLRTRDIPPTYFELGEPSPGCVILHRLSSSRSKQQQAEACMRYERDVG